MPNSADFQRGVLSLVMIVKDEAASIVETIESVRPYIDYFLILDTGSTDGTQKLVRKALDGVPGRLEEEPFVDFSTTRNRALDLLGTETVFALMLSGDETLRNGAALRAFCEKAAKADPDGAYHVPIEFGRTIYASSRLTLTTGNWRYVGKTHEVLVPPGRLPPVQTVPKARIFHDLSRRDDRDQNTKWERDRRLLAEQMREDPTDTRAAFYYAQTLDCLGEHEAAIAAYERRLAMGGWFEEIYESTARIARLGNLVGWEWSRVQQKYLDAHALSPSRAEPLTAIADHWYAERNWPLTYLFAARAAAIPFPEKATLFIDRTVYEKRAKDLLSISAYHVGEYDAGIEALHELIDRYPGDERFRGNLALYEEKVGRTAKRKVPLPAIS